MQEILRRDLTGQIRSVLNFVRLVADRQLVQPLRFALAAAARAHQFMANYAEPILVQAKARS